jgi:hypothetical protein
MVIILYEAFLAAGLSVLHRGPALQIQTGL